MKLTHLSEYLEKDEYEDSSKDENREYFEKYSPFIPLNFTSHHRAPDAVVILWHKAIVTVPSPASPALPELLDLSAAKPANRHR